MQKGVLKYEQNTLHIVKMGHGPQLLFAFHDVGQAADVFLPLEKEIGHKYSIIAIEIPGMGKSEWVEKKISKIALVTIFERFKLEFKVDKFDILAFGLGALYALTLIEQRSEWIEKVILFSPEGLRRSSWQHLATKHFWAKPKIQAAVLHPAKKEQKLKSLISWGLLKKDWIKPLHAYIDDENLQQVWNQVFPLHFILVPEIQKVRWNVKKDKLEVHIFCSDTHLLMKKDAKKFAKKQDQTFVEHWPETDLLNTSLWLEKAESILNPRQ